MLFPDQLLDALDKKISWLMCWLWFVELFFCLQN
jgi:hypothetical protein